MIDLIGSQPHSAQRLQEWQEEGRGAVSTQKQALSMSETQFAASLGKATARQHRGKDRKQDSATTTYE